METAVKTQNKYQVSIDLLNEAQERAYNLVKEKNPELADADALIPVAPSKLPLNVVNPDRKRWDVVNLDTVRFSAVDSLRQEGVYRAKRYRKVPNLVNVHS